MSLFDTSFGEFTRSCAKLYRAFLPWSLVVLVLSFAFEFARGVEMRRLLMFFTKIFVIILLTSEAHTLINSGQLVVDRFLDQSGLVRPEQIAQTYRDRLAVSLGEPDLADKSVLRLAVSGHLLDALLYAGLLGVSFLVLGVTTFITFVQKISLLICWSACPILFALLAIEPIAQLGSAHIMRIIAIICWPLGFAVAATFSDALLNMALHDRVLAGDSTPKTLAAAIENLLIIAAVGLWTVVSSVLAPVFIHRFLVGHGGVARIIAPTLGVVGALVTPATAAVASGVSFAVDSARSRWGGEGFSGSSSPSASPTPLSASSPHAPPPPAGSTPFGSSGPADPTGADELEQLINQE